MSSRGTGQLTKLEMPMNSPDRFALGATAVFLGVDLFNILHHEMWRDELQPWMVARASNSISDLITNIRYEGHPILWYILLYALTRFTKWIFAMQLLNLIVASATTYVIAAHSPFTKLGKLLLCFGYFPLYEYGTISRNYGLGAFFLFWFCALYRRDRKPSWLTATMLLSLLANTSVYGTIIAMALAFSLFAAPALAGGEARKLLPLQAAHAHAAAMIFCGSVAIAAVQMHPPPDSGYAMGWHLPTTFYSFGETASGLWRAFLPVPNSLAHFWNSNYFLEHLALRKRWTDLGSALILLTAFLLLARKRVALLFYATATGAILVFMHVKFMGYERHVGHLFLVFIAALWIAAQNPDDPLPLRPLDRAAQLMAGCRSTILGCLLFLHLVVAATACWIDWERPFSQGSAAAAFLHSHELATMFIIGDSDLAVSTIAGYLDRQIYYPKSHRLGSFIVYDRNRLGPRPNLIDAASKSPAPENEPVVIISSRPLQTGTGPARELAEFTGSIVGDEDFYIYLVGPIR